MIQNETFNEYIEAYKKLPLQKKKQMANEEVKKLLAFIEKANNDLNLNDTILFNREILDLNSDNVSDDDFVEAMFVYIYSIREALSIYFNTVSKILYK
ncbi:MAG: hypothetical protein MRZ34_00065 [Bacillales bacterium]|nr:hypothetical protein [Bacillales bacterium]